jgi:serine/threonine-protein kinase
MPAHDMTTIHCAGCQHAYSETALFCPNCGRPKVRETPADPLLGKVLGERFLVLDLLGQGGSGTIYRAEHVTLRRRVAIKVLHTELSRDDLAVERFRREATTVAEIDNEHIVEIHDFGRTPDGRLYLAMELLEGETLDAVLARDKQLSIERAADILIQLGEALMEAHAIGYVHRDLRPRNIYLSVRRGKANFVKLLDFGLAKLVEAEGQAASTSLGMTFGDPRYMSPEQARGDRIDRRADIYQLGCVAYEMLTGAPPFTGSRVFDILTKQVTEAPQPVPTRRPGTPLWMEAAVTKMLAKDPDNRFATTTRMVEALRRGLDTGEVMEDEVARRRESIPPPSVSRVMQRMGMLPEAAAPVAPVSRPQTPPPTPGAPGPGPVAAVGHAGTSAPQTKVGPPPVAIPPLVAKPASPALGDAGSRQRPGGSAGRAAPPPPADELARFDPGVTMKNPAVPPPHGSPTAAAPPQKPDSVELLRKRTGTPLIGVPVVPVPATQAPVAGVIEPVIPAPRSGSPSGAGTSPPASGSAPAPRESQASSVLVRSPMSPDDGQARGKRQNAADLNISQVWYEEGDQLGDPPSDGDGAAARSERARRMISPSTTDLAFYDERPRRGWGLVIALGVVVAIGGTLAFALTRGGPSTRPPAPVAAIEPPSATAPIDAAPSTIVATEPPAPEPPPSVVAGSTASAPTAPHRPVDTHRTVETRAPSVPRVPAVARRPATPQSFPVPGSEPTRRAPGAGLAAPAAPPPPARTPATPSLTDTPKDPYTSGDDASSDGATPEKKAEFFANLGSQQLIGGDTAGAAANFKKAIEIDGKNVTAAAGMGEIALRQGLFGDAIAHLSRASKLAPRSAKVLTLLGEAYLNSGKNQQAAAQFKKALVIDPDNARARDGYNEASSRVPPPDDETP